jgi:23S rRNA pseudouridine1911/1915/1917 synthase
MPPVHYKVRPEEQGTRLDRFLLKRCPELARSFIEKLIRKGECRVGEKRGTASLRLKAGQRVTLKEAPANAGIPTADARISFGVLYEDEHLVVVDKPPGLVVHPGPGHRRGTLLNGLMGPYGKDLARLGKRQDFGLVHRLDVDTSGALIVARNAKAYEHLVEQFRERRVRKTYLALVASIPRPPSGVIRASLGQTRTPRVHVLVEAGHNRKSATTRYRLKRPCGRFGLLEVNPETGRMHQIRAHLAHRHMPVVGDTEYGDASANAEARRQADLHRTFLHCHRLEFSHPRSGETISVVSELPADLMGILKRLTDKR